MAKMHRRAKTSTRYLFLIFHTIRNAIVAPITESRLDRTHTGHLCALHSTMSVMRRSSIEGPQNVGLAAAGGDRAEQPSTLALSDVGHRLLEMYS